MPEGLSDWAGDWRTRRARDVGAAEAGALMRAHSPLAIPRNHLVEEVIAAARAGDLGPFHAMNAALAEPYGDGPLTQLHARPPAPSERVTATFCGT